MADAKSWNTERSGSSEHDESAAGSSCKPALDWGAYCRAWGEVAGRRCRRAATGAEHCSHSSGVVLSSRAAVRSNDTNDFGFCHPTGQNLNLTPRRALKEAANHKQVSPRDTCRLVKSATSSNGLEIEARIEILAGGREVLDPGIRHEEVGRLLQPIGDRAVRIEPFPVA